MNRINGIIQKVSDNIYGWSGYRAVIIPTSQGDIDVRVPKDRWIGDNGNLYYAAFMDGDDNVTIESNEDYTHGHFLNSRRTDPEKKVIFRAEKTDQDVWEIKENLLPEGSVKQSPPNTYWKQFGRYYWDMAA